MGVNGTGWHSYNPHTVDSDMALVLLHPSQPSLRVPHLQVIIRELHYVTVGVTLSVCALCCRYVNLPAGSMGIYDPTEIRNRGLLSRFQKEAFVKIAYHLITFFIALYGLVLTCSCVCAKFTAVFSCTVLLWLYSSDRQ